MLRDEQADVQNNGPTEVPIAYVIATNALCSDVVHRSTSDPQYWILSLNLFANSVEESCVFNKKYDLTDVICRAAGASPEVNPGIYKPENPQAQRDQPARNDDGQSKNCFLFSSL